MRAAAARREAARPGRSTWRMAVSMPRPSTSTFSSPGRRGRPCPTGSRCARAWRRSRSAPARTSGPSEITKPPTCCDRCRGKPEQLARQLEQPRAAPGCVRIDARLAQPRRLDAMRRASRCMRRASCSLRGSGSRPSALPTSRTALRALVGDHGGGQRRALAAVLAVDVLDHLLAPLVLEVDVDVRRLVALARDEALEQHRHAAPGRPR